MWPHRSTWKASQPDPMIRTAEQAGFWYNPNRGIFSARVMPQFTDRETLALYNRLNGTTLLGLPNSSDPPRQSQRFESLNSSEARPARKETDRGKAKLAPAPASLVPAPHKQPSAGVVNTKVNARVRPTLNNHIHR